MNTKGGYGMIKMASEVQQDTRAQKYLREELLRVIKGL